MTDDEREALATRLEALEAERQWQPIETAPKDTTLILGHNYRKWLRFGRLITEVGRWYYSGTSERSQYAQLVGDEPTHWMPLPAPPGGPDNA